MKIRYNSWHARLIRGLHKDWEPKSLCTYFWALVLCLLQMLIVIVLLTISSPLWVPVAIAVYLGYLIYQKWKTMNNQPHKEAGLIMAYVLAKKQKVCPLIEYVHNDEE